MKYLVLLALAGFIVFYGILLLPISGLYKFGLVCVEMIAINQFMIRKYGFSSEMGFVLLKSKHGLEIIKNISKYENAWKFFADTGTVMSYGILSFAMARKNVNWKSFAAGMILITVLMAVVAPYVLPFLLVVIQFKEIQSQVKDVAGIGGPNDYFMIAIMGALYLGGFFLLMTLGVIGGAAMIIAKIANALVYGSGALKDIHAGATFILPGINIPLFEGIAALFFILVVHEGAHAVLSLIARVPVLSSGIVLFGVIPIGAFVEPDEAKLKRADADKQTRVIVAGSAANLMSAIVFFALFMGFFFISSPFKEQGLLVTAGMDKDTIIYSANGKAPDTYNYGGMSLPANSRITLDTNKGIIISNTNNGGKLGIYVVPINKDSLLAKYKLPGFEFVYVVLGLGFALNFIIGTVNILPIPLFDGYRALDINIKNKVVVKAIMALTFIAFAVNLLPNIFGG